MIVLFYLLLMVNVNNKELLLMDFTMIKKLINILNVMKNVVLVHLSMFVLVVKLLILKMETYAYKNVLMVNLFNKIPQDCNVYNVMKIVLNVMVLLIHNVNNVNRIYSGLIIPVYQNALKKLLNTISKLLQLQMNLTLNVKNVIRDAVNANKNMITVQLVKIPSFCTIINVLKNVKKDII